MILNNRMVLSFLFLSVILHIEFLLSQDRTKYPIIIAHRGGIEYYPENTIESLSYAADSGIKAVETDIRFSRDKIVVIRHDSLLSVTTNVLDFYGRDYAVSELTFEEIENLSIDRGNGFYKNIDERPHIPSLKDVLVALRHSTCDVVLDLKENSKELQDSALSIIRASGFDSSRIIFNNYSGSLPILWRKSVSQIVKAQPDPHYNSEGLLLNGEYGLSFSDSSLYKSDEFELKLNFTALDSTITSVQPIVRIVNNHNIDTVYLGLNYVAPYQIHLFLKCNNKYLSSKATLTTLNDLKFSLKHCKDSVTLFENSKCIITIKKDTNTFWAPKQRIFIAVDRYNSQFLFSTLKYVDYISQGKTVLLDFQINHFSNSYLNDNCGLINFPHFGGDYAGIPLEKYSPEYSRWLRSLGYLPRVWSISDESDFYRMLADTNVNGIYTLYPLKYQNIILSIKDNALPEDYTIFSSFPNPFNSKVTLTFLSFKKTQYLIRIYDLLGRNIACFRGDAIIGQNYISWDLNQNKYSNISSGIYFAVLHLEENVKMLKLMYLK